MIPHLRQQLLEYDAATDTEIAVTARVSSGRGADGQLPVSEGRLSLPIGPRAREGSNLPLVSCLMPTKNRFEQARFAIGRYRAQTWPNKELIVVDQTPDSPLASWIQSLSDPSIRFVPVVGVSQTLGDFRNISLDLARGNLICQWDDDDLQHPARLEIALNAMRITRVPACFLLREIVWVPRQGRLAIGPERWNEHTVLCRRDAAQRYPSLNLQEDSQATQAMIDTTPTVLLDLPELYVYVLHGRNAWDAANFPKLWNKCTYRAEGSEAEAGVEMLSGVYPLSAYRTMLHERDAASGAGQIGVAATGAAGQD